MVIVFHAMMRSVMLQIHIYLLQEMDICKYLVFGKFAHERGLMLEEITFNNPKDWYV